MDPQALLYQACRTLSAFVRRAPRSWALASADLVAALVWSLYRATPWRDHVQGVVRRAEGLGLSAPEVQAVARSHVRELARNIVELLRLPGLPDEAPPPVAEVVGWEHVEAAREAGRGILVATAHYGNWELLGATLVARGLPLHVLTQRPSQAAFERLFVETRRAVGVASWPNTGPASLRPVLRALQRGEALGLLIDQHGEGQEAIVTLLGRPVSAPVGPVYFARRTGAVILPMRIVRRPDGRHRLEVEPPQGLTGDDEVDMQHLYATVERWIRERPDHWLWVHDRWAREAELRRPPVAPGRPRPAPLPVGERS